MIINNNPYIINNKQHSSKENAVSFPKYSHNKIDQVSFAGKANAADSMIKKLYNKTLQGMVKPMKWLSEREAMQRIGKWANEDETKIIKVKILSEENGKTVKRTIKQKKQSKKIKNLQPVP